MRDTGERMRGRGATKGAQKGKLTGSERAPDKIPVTPAPKDFRVLTPTDLASQFPEWRQCALLVKLTNGSWSFTTSVSR